MTTSIPQHLTPASVMTKSTIKTDLKYRIWLVPCISLCHIPLGPWRPHSSILSSLFHNCSVIPFHGVPWNTLSIINKFPYILNLLLLLTLFLQSIKWAHVSAILKRINHHLSFTQQATTLNFAFHFEFPTLSPPSIPVTLCSTSAYLFLPLSYVQTYELSIHLDLTYLIKPPFVKFSPSLAFVTSLQFGLLLATFFIYFMVTLQIMEFTILSSLFECYVSFTGKSHSYIWFPALYLHPRLLSWAPDSRHLPTGYFHFDMLQALKLNMSEMNSTSFLFYKPVPNPTTSQLYCSAQKPGVSLPLLCSLSSLPPIHPPYHCKNDLSKLQI